MESVLKATIAMLIFYSFYQCFLAKENMFGFNRFFLIFALAFVLIKGDSRSRFRKYFFFDRDSDFQLDYGT